MSHALLSRALFAARFCRDTNLDVLRIWQASVHLTQLSLSLIWYYLPTQTQTACNFMGHAHAHFYGILGP
jgi:hypothetical protein